MRNKLPFLPGRNCLKKTGPFNIDFIKITKINEGIAKIISPIKLIIRSNIRFTINLILIKFALMLLGDFFDKINF
jgi:hypothetical protein